MFNSQKKSLLEFEFFKRDKIPEYSDELANFFGIDKVLWDDKEVEAVINLVEMSNSKGQICGQDTMFFALFLKLFSVKNFVEIGTASGMSAVVIINFLSMWHKHKETTNFHTIDIKKHSPDGKKIGYLLEEQGSLPNVNIEIHKKQKSFFIPKILESKSVQMAFIDGNHRHPWPLQDFLNLLFVLDDNAIVIFHDVDLPNVIQRLSKERENYNDYAAEGAKYVFDNWPLTKIRRGNIGAVVVPEDRQVIKPFVEKLVNIPLETDKDLTGKRKRDLKVTFGKIFL